MPIHKPKPKKKVYKIENEITNTTDNTLSTADQSLPNATNIHKNSLATTQLLGLNNSPSQSSCAHRELPKPLLALFDKDFGGIFADIEAIEQYESKKSHHKPSQKKSPLAESKEIPCDNENVTKKRLQAKRSHSPTLRDDERCSVPVKCLGLHELSLDASKAILRKRRVKYSSLSLRSGKYEPNKENDTFDLESVELLTFAECAPNAHKRRAYTDDTIQLNKRPCTELEDNNNNTQPKSMYEHMPPQSAQNQSASDFLASKLSHSLTISNNNINNNNINGVGGSSSNNNNNNNNNNIIIDDMYSESNSSSHSSAGSAHLHHHHNHHSSNNSSSSSNQAQQLHNKQISASSMATLCNIGNTCYLNSVVYTLRFAPYFLHNLHHLVEDLSQINQKLGQNKAKSSSLGRNVGGLQGPNTRSWSTKDLASMGNLVADVPRTNRQIATEKLHELYNRLHLSEVTESTDAFHADTFLSAVQDVSSIFEGNQQQDAHEFLMCILDSIRETCQSLTKVITECPDIIMNGYVSLPEKIVPQPPAQPAIARFFRKLNKEDKTKQARLHSPSRDSSGVTSDTTTHNATAAATNDEENQHKEKMSEKMGEKIKKLGLDFFTEDFEGITVSSTKCLSCETVTEQKETMIDLSVPVTGYENIDTIGNANQFIKRLCITREQFNSENKYRCEVCTGLTEACRTVSYPVLPRLLIIQLKRFSGGMEKINSYIPTPFTMQCFCSKCCALEDDKKLHVYKLYSVITHVGATLSVGHYIAYTCSLEGYSDYMSCPKDKRKAAQSSTAANNGSSNGGTTNGTSGSAAAVAAALADKNPGRIKKIIFGRTKASSSGDVTKNVKNLNGPIKQSANGIDKSASPAHDTCPGLNCCGILLKSAPATVNGQLNGAVDHHHHGAALSSKPSFSSASSDFYGTSVPLSTAVSMQNGSSDKFGGSAAAKEAACIAAVTGVSTSVDTTWYMCDDDKIKAMSQREFEELLLPNSKKIMITPYLLFYARTDVQ